MKVYVETVTMAAGMEGPGQYGPKLTEAIDRVESSGWVLWNITSVFTSLRAGDSMLYTLIFRPAA